MSRLTGKEVYSLMEAYQAVYAPQELTEEQVWEGVENWVHSLLEEGYDLSDYTWEEMYENYLTESPALAIPLAPYAAPYALPALGAAAALIKNNLNKTNKMVTTPDEERFLNTGSFASRQDDPNKQPAKKSGGEGFGNTPKDDDKGTKITNVPGPNIRGKQPVEPPKVDPPTKQPVEQPPKQPVEQPPTKPPVDPPVKRSVYDRKGEFLPGKPGDVQLHRNFYPYRSVFDRKVEFLPGKPGDVQLHRNFYPYNQLPVQPRTNDPGGRGPNLTITTDPVKIVKPVVRVKPSDFNSSGRDQLINRPPVKKEVKPEVKKEVKPEVKKEVKPEVKKEGEPGQSSRQSVIPRTSATPVNSGPNFLQRKVAQFRTGYVGSSGASTAERLGNVVGAGAKLTKGGAEFAAKNFVTKPIGAIGGLGAIAGIGGLAGYGLYKAGKYGYNKYKENQPKSKKFPPPPERLTNQFQNFESDNLNVINEGPNFPTTKPKSNYDQLTIGGITKLWDPASNSYQLPGTINKRLESEGEDLITVPGKAKPDPVTPLTPAQRATQQRLDAGVVKGGKSGFKSLVPKPTPQKRESAEKFKARQSRYEDSQRLAQTLTQSQQKTADAAAKATADAAAKATADAAAKATADAAAKATADAAAKATADAAAKAKADAEKAKTRTATTGTATTGTATTGTATTGTATTRTTTQKPTLPPVSVAQTGNRNTDLTTWANANKGMINKVGTQQQKDILSAVESGKPLPKAPESIKDQVKNMQKIRMQSESTAYDIVLDYLISTNQVDTIEEAHYVMMQLDSEYIGNIVEEWRPVENLDEKARGTRKKKNIHAYDVDETLFKHGEKGKPTVQVHVNDSSGKRVQSLSNQDFNTHKLDKDKGHSYDFSEFQNAKKFGETSSPNKKVIKDLKRKQARGQNVHIITARSKFDNPSEFQGHLQKHGIDIPKNKIHYTGGMKGSDVGTKKVDTAKGIAKQSGAKQISMYDDAPKVNNAFEKEKQNNSTFTRIKTYLAKPNASGETTLRSYQATK